MLQIVHAHTAEHLSTVRALFLEYAEALGFDLCFQDFDTELASLPGEYGPPRGRLLLAFHDASEAGCVALRAIDESACEMKRLYIRPACRGLGVGRALAAALIDEARKIGYDVMRLDTVPAMTAAIALYESLGFQDIQAYRYNPLKGARFMELSL
ncbi:MAG: GNAT family N-acetyltransferase [Phycisphaerae bacterium]|jgi:ribosomal protein S18 acetylase RimI-like enzyme